MENEQTQTQEEVVDTTNVAETVEEEVAQEEVVEEQKSMEQIQQELEEAQRKIHEQHKEMLEDKKASLLKDNGLEAFADFVVAEDFEQLEKSVKALTKIVNDIKVANSYQPKDNGKQDAYSVHVKNKDTKNMIGSKLAGLFK